MVVSVMGLFGLLSQVLSIFGGGARRQNGVYVSASPVARLIVFSAAGKGEGDLYLLDPDSHKVTRIAETPQYEFSPSFSPDGKHLLFSASDSRGKPAHLYLCGLDGRNRSQLTHGNVYDSGGSFSADGRKIVFTRAARNRPYSMGGYTWDQWDAWTSDSDGSNPKQVTHEKYYQMTPPRLSHAGREIVYSADHHLDGPLTTDLFQVQSGGGKHPERLTRDGHSSGCAVSPDGKHIVFISDREKHFDYELWVMHPDGTAQKQITHNRAYNYKPAFASDSRRVLFLSDPARASRYDLWEIDISGANLKMLADSSLFDDPLNWRPR